MEEKPLPISDSELAYAPKLSSAATDGMIKVRLQEDVVIQRVSHDLYDDPESGFRELYNNEVRACRMAEAQYGATPHINVVLDPKERTVVIDGVDSMGISQQKFLDIYTYLGRSDNFSGSEPGQWGFGKASYTCLSDTMLLETKSREDGSRYAVLGKGGIGFSLLPEPNMGHYGTRVSLVIRKKIDFGNLARYIMRCTMFSGIPTVVEAKSDITTDYHKNVLPAGSYNTGTTDPFDYLHSDHYITDVVDDDDFTLWMALVEEKKDEASRWPYESVNLLLSVPIEIYGLSIPGVRYVLRIKDERKYLPTMDREHLTENATLALQARIDDVLSARYSWANIHTIDQFCALDKTKQRIYIDALGDVIERWGYDSELLALLKGRVRYFYKYEMGRGTIYTSRLCDLLAENRRLYLSRHLDGKLNMAIWRFAGGILIAPPNSDERYPTYEDLKNYIPDARQYLKQNGKSINILAPLSSPIFHIASIQRHGWGRYLGVSCTTTNTVDDTHTVIRIPRGRMKMYKSLLSKCNTKYVLTIDREDMKMGMSLETFIAKTSNMRVLTSKGTKTIDQLTRARKEVEVYIYHRPDIAEFFRHDDRILIFATDDTAFTIGMAMKYAGRDCNIYSNIENLYEGDWPYDALYCTSYLKQYGDSQRCLSVIHVGMYAGEKYGRLMATYARHYDGITEVEEMCDYLLQNLPRAASGRNFFG